MTQPDPTPTGPQPSGPQPSGQQLSGPQRLAAIMRELMALEKAAVTSLQSDRNRGRGEKIRHLHEIRRMANPGGYPYASQAAQDLVVDGALGQKRGGTFVDIGGYDGVTGSNTLFFEQWRGWTGVLIEPVPAMLAKAQAVRSCPCLGLAVAASDGEAEFLEISEGYTQMSGLAGSYDPALLARVRADPRHYETTIRVQTRTISRILSDAGLPHPDFISLDIEGGELAALRDFPFADHRVGLWAIENNSGTDAIGQIMQANGYRLIEFCGPDEIWQRHDL